ncbi:MAG: hypothetical protein FJ040_12505 [Chloroflexi bacterium]|nr:hypothetical protein [Chloroflexota bacterium]
MPPHPYFDLELLDNITLNHYLLAPIETRHIIHEWPLSCVERLTCRDGSQHIYKSQRPPSVESELYSMVTAPHLLPATIIQPHHLLLPFITSTPIHDAAYAVRQIRTAIAAMPVQTPVYRTLDTIDAWETLIDRIVRTLRQLVQATTFVHLTLADIAHIEASAHHPDVLALWQGEIGVVHGDITLANLLNTPHQTYVIDWQRPMYAPTVIDTWMLERALQLPISTPLATQMLCTILEMCWLTEAATQWFPRGMAHYDAQIAQRAQQC